MKPLRFVKDPDIDYVVPVMQVLKNDTSIARLKGKALFEALKQKVPGISDESLLRVLKEIAVAA